jgi:hypothetical protein
MPVVVFTLHGLRLSGDSGRRKYASGEGEAQMLWGKSKLHPLGGEKHLYFDGAFGRGRARRLAAGEIPVKKKTGKSKQKTNSTKVAESALREQLAYLLKGGGAHVHFMDALDDFPGGKRGLFVKGLPHTGWQLLEHVRIAQWDILEFSRSAKHVSPDFPGGYWPKTPVPPDDEAWEKSVKSFERDLAEMIKLVKNPKTDLFGKIPHGSGQTILREALVLADHNSYHLGQLVDLRRSIGAWPEP